MNKMCIREVFQALMTEITYQDKMKKVSSSHVVEDFPLSSALEAIRYNLEIANKKWYNGKAPYQDAMEYVRKIGAICISTGEKYGMPYRDEPERMLHLNGDYISLEHENHEKVYQCVASDMNSAAFAPTEVEGDSLYTLYKDIFVINNWGDLVKYKKYSANEVIRSFQPTTENSGEESPVQSEEVPNNL